MADRNSPQKYVWRAQIILLTADGGGTAEIMRASGTSKTSVWRWQERFMTEGVSGLLRDKTRPSRIAPLGAEVETRVVQATLIGPSPGEATHWTAPAMAKLQGFSASSVQRIWHRHGLQLHRTRRFKLSNDPEFARKLRDIVGLYVNPPAHAIALSVDEKNQIQALDRTQPGSPLKKGRCGTMTHDYKRDDTTTLFAALNVLNGKAVGRCMPKHRHQEYIRFLNAVEATMPAGKHVHAIVDNYATHKHPKVREWLAEFPPHANIRLLAQRRRRLLCQADKAPPRPWRVPLGRGTQRRHRTVPHRKQSRPTAIPMDKKNQTKFWPP